MKNYLKYLMLITIVLLITTSFVYAQPVPIGAATQPYPFESNPTANSKSHATYVTFSGATATYDGDMGLGGYAAVANTAATSPAWVQVYTFTTPAVEFTIGWVDIKICYEVGSLTGDDTYKFVYTTVASPGDADWIELTPAVSYADGAFTKAIFPKAQVLPNDNTWDWTDIGNLKVRLFFTKVGTWETAKRIYIYEVWASVYPSPLPPSGGSPSTHLSVIPSSIATIGTGDWFFVDIYVTDVSNLRGYYLLLTFDKDVLTPDSVWVYNPFQYVTVESELNDTTGWVIMQQSSMAGKPSVTGSQPIARIYFSVDAAGTSSLNIINKAEFDAGTWPTGVSETKLKDIYAADISHQVHDGSYGVAVPEFPLGIEIIMAIAPLITIIYLWRKHPKKRV